MRFVQAPGYHGLINLDTVERAKKVVACSFYSIKIYFVSGKVFDMEFKTEEESQAFYSYLVEGSVHGEYPIGTDYR